MNILILLLLVLILVLQIFMGIFLVRFQQITSEFFSDIVNSLKYLSDLSLNNRKNKSGTWDEKYEVQENYRNQMIRREVGEGLQDISEKS